MNDRKPLLVGLALVVIAIGAGAYVYARFEMESRIRGYSGAVDGIGYARGGRIPTEEQFTAQARAAAEDLGLEVERFEVTRTVESGLDTAGNLMQKQMGDSATLRMELVRYTVRTSVVAHKWIFSRKGELAVDRTYRREVHLDTPNQRTPPPALDQPAEPRGL